MSWPNKKAPPWPHGDPSSIDWARVSGFFSGEGCILTHLHSKQGSISPRLTVSQKYEEPLLWIQSVFGGRIMKQGDQPSRYGRGPRYVWIISSKAEVVRMLKGMYPHLLTKKKQAALVINLVDQPREVQQAIHYRLKVLKRTCA